MSIKQNFSTDALPDFRNPGVVARILLGVNALAFAGALVAEPTWSRALERFMHGAVLVEPMLLATLVLLYAVAPLLARLPYWTGCAAVAALALAASGALHIAVAGPELELEIGRAHV